MLPVTVTRSTWYRGKDAMMSRLLRFDGQMCCLGFACLQAGILPAEMLNVSYPSAIQPSSVPFPESLHGLVRTVGTGPEQHTHSSNICRAISEINDRVAIGTIEREFLLKRLGEEADIAFTFVD